jgi:Fic family protein
METRAGPPVPYSRAIFLRFLR